MTFHDIVMVKGKAGVTCLFLLLVLICGAVVSAQEESSAPSLEFSPSSDEVVPEQAPVVREQPRALFTKSIGGFGISRESFDRPMDVAYDSEGDYYVLDSGNSRVQKFSSRDRFVLEWGSSGYRKGNFDNPRAVAVDAEDAVYVVDSGNNRIQKFDGEGDLLFTWGRLGSAPGKFIEPLDIAFDLEGSIYILDGGDQRRIQKFSSAGVFVEQWGRFQGGRQGDFT
jgi:tripartite motif-containing protein 71